MMVEVERGSETLQWPSEQGESLRFRDAHFKDKVRD